MLRPYFVSFVVNISISMWLRLCHAVQSVGEITNSVKQSWLIWFALADEKIFESRDHDVGQTFVVTFHVAVVS